MKTMTKIVSTESQNRKDFKTPDKDTLDLLAASSAGDIRACINSLQFYCTNGKILIADSSFCLSKDMIIFSSKKNYLSLRTKNVSKLFIRPQYILLVLASGVLFAITLRT